MATDFQSLLSAENVPGYANAPPGLQLVYRLALLQLIANELAPSQPTDYQSLLNYANVNCYASCLTPGEIALLKKALLQIIVTGGPSPAVAWSPTTPISGATLVEWLKGDSLTGASGSAISDWPATTGKDATQSVGSAQPTVLTGTYAFPVARFNGSSDILVANAVPSATQPFTVAMFFEYKGAAATANIINGGAAGGIGIASSNFYGAAPTSVSVRASDNNSHILFMVFNGASSTYGFDGAALSTFSSSPGANAWANSINIGAGVGLSNPAQVDIGEIIIWSGDATAAYSNVYTYLFNRWG